MGASLKKMEHYAFIVQQNLKYLEWKGTIINFVLGINYDWINDFT